MVEQETTTIDVDAELASNAKLRHACRKAIENWFPANPKTLNRIHLGIEAGSYDLDIEFLVREIKSDFALFTYVLKELARMRDRGIVQFPQGANPIEMMRSAGYEKLKNLLTVHEREISHHDGGKMDQFQALRLQESMVSASTAEVLSNKENIDPSIGFTTGLLRQLGLTLIAWNYPHVYQSVANNLTSVATLDDELARALGFSPKLLGLTMARHWGLGLELRTALGDVSSEAELKTKEPGLSAKLAKIQEIGEKLDEICEIGEALARSSLPEQYPTAGEDWVEAKERISKRLGSEGIKVIQDKVKQNVENYALMRPEIFRKLDLVEPDSKWASFKEEQLYKLNGYTKNCGKKAQKLFLKFYRVLDQEGISKENIRLLMQGVVPLLGFTRGCIFLSDPRTSELAPRLTIGESVLEDYPTISYREAEAGENLLSDAYSNDTPVIDDPKNDGRGEGPFAIASVVGKKSRAGVLYLEASDELLTDKNEVPLVLFKAVHKALVDCLKLK